MLKHEINDENIWDRIRKLRTNDICELAPKFRKSIKNVIEECNLIGHIFDEEGRKYEFDPIIFETIRNNELQNIYYNQKVTKARHAFYSWHFYGLAVDVISKSMGWNVPMKWWDTLGEIVKRNNLRWGGDWNIKDYPHIQWGVMVDTPKRAPYIYFNTKTITKFSRIEDEVEHKNGLMRVWKEVRAL